MAARDGVWIARYLPSAPQGDFVSLTIDEIRKSEGLTIDPRDWVALDPFLSSPVGELVACNRRVIDGKILYITRDKMLVWIALSDVPSGSQSTPSTRSDLED
jgi:hypothetical protein